VVHSLGPRQSEWMGVILDGRDRRLRIDGGNGLRERVVQLSKATKSRGLRPFLRGEDHSGQVYDDSRGDGRHRGEDGTRLKTDRWWSRSPKANKKESQVARGAGGDSLRRRGSPSEVLESVGRRHGG